MNVNEQLSASCSLILNVVPHNKVSLAVCLKVEDDEQLSLTGLVYHEPVQSGLHLYLLTLPKLLHPGCYFGQDQ